MKKNILTALLLACVIPLAAQKFDKIWGVVEDATSRQPLAGVQVAIFGQTQNDYSDENGNFKTIGENLPPRVRLQFTKDGYERHEEEVALPMNSPMLVRLTPITKPALTITHVTIGDRIKGTVSGWSATGERHKIVVYIHTNLYYIHPYANSSLQVTANGEWQIQSVRHEGPCPDMVMAAIVKADFTPPSKIDGPLSEFIEWTIINDASKIICR